jgi:hypothetical protein
VVLRTGFTLSVSNSLSGRDRQLNEAPAVGDPTHAVQIGRGHRVHGESLIRARFWGFRDLATIERCVISRLSSANIFDNAAQAAASNRYS